MKNIWNLIVHGYIPVRGMNPTGRLSIKLLVLLIGVIMIYNYLI
jgi:hypothetical protein|tara:strand:- start:472 stop:603 length:132 start_codon:yes stop_codon:yes gene_type:complete